MKKIKYICIFGDSITWGAWDVEKGGWVNRLWLYFAKRKNDKVRIFNLSVSFSATTEVILKHFENEAKSRNANALIFQIGVNDSCYHDKPDSFLVQPEKFKENILEIINRAKKITNNILFLSLTNCDESKTMPGLFGKRNYYTNKNIEKYSKIVEDVCKNESISFLNIGSLDNADFDDGLHPNKEGHLKIFEAVKDYLVKNDCKFQ